MIEQARQVLIKKIEELRTKWTDYELEVEYPNNIEVNYPTQSNPFLRVSILYQDGWQMELARDPAHRMLGTIVIEAVGKEGSGASQVNKLLKHFYPHIHMTDKLKPLRTYAGKPSSIPAKQGWVVQAMIIPFWFDDFQRE